MSKKEVLSKSVTLCWAAFIAILARMWPAGHRLDTSASVRLAGCTYWKASDLLRGVAQSCQKFKH